MLCPCCSNISFNDCCKPIIEGSKIAVSPESLMRSRYTAYTLNDIDYIYDTYATDARQQQSKQALRESASNTKWIKLQISASDSISTPASVTFTAFYLEQDKYCQMSECSYFVKEDGRWFYSTGDILLHEQISRIKRNDLCPCTSNKKFKKCCG